MIKIKRKIIFSIVSIVILLSLVFCIFELNNYYERSIVPKQLETVISGDQQSSPQQFGNELSTTETGLGSNNSRNITEPVDVPAKFFRTQDIPISTSSGDQSIPPSSSPKSGEGTYSYLFERNKQPNTSNIVGYFAHGAFAWYVPDWLVNNWEMKPFRADGMIFSPKVRATPATGQQYDFSDIVFDVSTSTELSNAYSLYMTMLGSISKDEIIISEVLLNKSTTDMVSIQMENSTRIYHITAYTRDFKRISDIYFMDGNGKTLDLRFETKANIFSQFSDKIRDMVEGVGELKSPQG